MHIRKINMTFTGQNAKPVLQDIDILVLYRRKKINSKFSQSCAMAHVRNRLNAKLVGLHILMVVNSQQSSQLA